jgi:hypothetical protein
MDHKGGNILTEPGAEASKDSKERKPRRRTVAAQGELRPKKKSRKAKGTAIVVADPPTDEEKPSEINPSSSRNLSTNPVEDESNDAEIAQLKRKLEQSRAEKDEFWNQIEQILPLKSTEGGRESSARNPNSFPQVG